MPKRLPFDPREILQIAIDKRGASTRSTRSARTWDLHRCTDPAYVCSELLADYTG